MTLGTRSSSATGRRASEGRAREGFGRYSGPSYAPAPGLCPAPRSPSRPAQDTLLKQSGSSPLRPGASREPPALEDGEDLVLSGRETKTGLLEGRSAEGLKSLKIIYTLVH